MWVIDPSDGYPGKTRFLGRPWAKCSGGSQNRCFGGLRQRFVDRDWGQPQGCDPIGVVIGPCGYPEG